MSYDSLLFEVKDGVGLIRLNRPDDGNALTLEMAQELLDVASRCDADPEVRAVVLTGTGKMFCAGGDLKAFAAQGDQVSLYMKQITQAFHAAVSRFCWMALSPSKIIATMGPELIKVVRLSKNGRSWWTA